MYDNIYRTRHSNIQTFIQMISLTSFIMGVCQREHLYESLYDCVSCSVYIVVHLMLFHLLWMCVSETNIQTFIQMFSLTHTHYKWNNIRCTTIYIGQDTQTYKLSYRCSLYVWVSCPVYIVVHLMLFHL
jgi:hypothetical protein